MNTYTVKRSDADIVYDVVSARHVADDRPPLVMIGQPMEAGGFRALASYFPERVVVTYDPRGLGRSVRKDGDVISSPVIQAEDVHAVITALGAGRVDLFASSGGAVTALALVAAYPHDVVTLVAHEPPLPGVLPDGLAAEHALAVVRETYYSHGFGAGMAAFIAMTSWRGEFTDEYFAMPAPDPAMFGMPPGDDGSRDDPLLSERSRAVTDYQIDRAALKESTTRIVIGVGEESEGLFTGRAAVAVAGLLGQRALVFPSHHGGFAAEDSGYPGQPEAFARRLREILDAEL
ncbi:MAG: alpha/beta hydrolase [Terrimesophilobacter sp.]